MLAHVLHPLGVHPRNLPAPQDHLYVLRRLWETLQETQRDGIRLCDITQSLTPHTHTPSPLHKRRGTDTGGTHSTPGALGTTQHDAPDPPASGAATSRRYPASYHRGAQRQAPLRRHEANRKPQDASTHANGHRYAQPHRTQACSRRNRLTQPKAPTQIKPELHPITANP